jgi:hypothetical protein
MNEYETPTTNVGGRNRDSEWDATVWKARTVVKNAGSGMPDPAWHDSGAAGRC